MPEITKMTIISLIFVRFSIRNQRWKAKKVSFVPRLLDMTLLERPAPLLGRLRYVVLSISKMCKASYMLCRQKKKLFICIGLKILLLLRKQLQVVSCWYQGLI